MNYSRFHIIAEKCAMYCLTSGLKAVPRMANTLSRGVFTSVGREVKVFSGLQAVGFEEIDCSIIQGVLIGMKTELEN